MKKITKVVSSVIVAGMVGMGLVACESGADKVNQNISTAADNFEVQRHIVGVNGITDRYAFEVVGRCSINDQGRQLEVVCKHGPDDYKKHMLGLSDNVYYVAEQLETVDASEYHTRIIIKPQNLIPDVDLQTSK